MAVGAETICHYAAVEKWPSFSAYCNFDYCEWEVTCTY